VPNISMRVESSIVLFLIPSYVTIL